MASSDRVSGPMPGGDGSVPPGKPMMAGQQVLDKGPQLMQSLKPVRQTSQHLCTFAMYSHDVTCQIRTHHYMKRVNQEFLQCPVYDDSNARLIGVEYIISDHLFYSLPVEEQKLWHSHAHEIISGLWVNPRVPGIVQKPELENLASTYGKFWCTWQVDKGDKLPLGAPVLMMSPQGVNLGIIDLKLVQEERDKKFKISTDDVKISRADMQIRALLQTTESAQGRDSL